jgi:hypothetical protein
VLQNWLWHLSRFRVAGLVLMPIIVKGGMDGLWSKAFCDDCGVPPTHAAWVHSGSMFQEVHTLPGIMLVFDKGKPNYPDPG